MSNLKSFGFPKQTIPPKEKTSRLTLNPKRVTGILKNGPPSPGLREGHFPLIPSNCKEQPGRGADFAGGPGPSGARAAGGAALGAAPGAEDAARRKSRVVAGGG